MIDIPSLNTKEWRQPCKALPSTKKSEKAREFRPHIRRAWSETTTSCTYNPDTRPPGSPKKAGKDLPVAVSKTRGDNCGSNPGQEIACELVITLPEFICNRLNQLQGPASVHSYLSEPYKNDVSFQVNIPHLQDLLCSFSSVALVDANSIYPYEH
jgi:hypothetical protein